jgi:hypothetical protein
MTGVLRLGDADKNRLPVAKTKSKDEQPFGIPVRTENVVARPDSAAKAFVGVGGVSPADAGSR